MRPFPEVELMILKLIDGECFAEEFVDFLSAEEVGLIVSLCLAGVLQFFP